MPRKRKLTRGQVLMYLHLAGYNRALAAARAGVSRATIFNAMRRYGIKAPHVAEKLTHADAELIRALASEGMRQSEIAQKFECAQSVVSRVVSCSIR